MIIVPPTIEELDQTVWMPGRLMQPELLIPGRKPVGPVEIDWTNPLTRGLDFYVPFFRGLTRDIINGYAGTPGNNAAPAVSKGEEVFTFDGVDDYISYTSTDPGFDQSQPWTIIARARLPSFIDTFPTIVAFKRTNTTVPLLLLLSNHGSYSPLAIIARTPDVTIRGMGSPAVPALDDGLFHNIAITFKGGTSTTIANYRMFVDGKSYPVSGSAGVGITANNTRIGGIDGASAEDWNGDISFVGRLPGNGWSEAEGISFTRNPYQILKPKLQLGMTTNARDDNSHAMLPDARLLAPEMLIPGRKPVGEVEIDWADSKMTDLEFFYLMESKGLTRNLAEKPLFGDGVAQNAPYVTFGHDQYGSYHETDGVGPEAVYVNGNVDTSMGTEYTLLAVVQMLSTASDKILLGGLSWNNGGYGFDFNGSTMMQHAADGAFATWTDIYAINEKHVYMLTRSGDTAHLYRDGVDLGAKTGFGTNVFKWSELVSYANGVNVFNGRTYALAGWTRSMSPGEVQQRSLDYYAGLKPKAKAPVIIQPPHQAKAGFHLPDSRLEMPSLLIPGRKPVGDVAVDWEHPLTEGLISYMLIDSLTSVDLVQFVPPDDTQDMQMTTTANGRGVTWAGTNNGNYEIPIPRVNTWTMVGNVHYGTTASKAVFHASDGGGINKHPQVFRVDDRWQIRKDGATEQGVVGTDILNNINDTVALDCTGGVVGNAWLNGILDATATAVNNDSFYIDHVGSGNSYGWGPTTTGSLRWCGVWNRVLTPAEHASLAANPYQFLIPA